MRPTLSFLIITIVALLIGTPALDGQSRCQLSDTIRQCWDRYWEGEAQGDAKANAGNASVDALSGKATGVDLPSDDAGSVVKDFLPLLQLSGLLGGIAEDDDEGTLSLDLNLPILADDRNFQTRVTFSTDPGLFGPLSESIPEAEREDRVKALEEPLDAFDDVKVSLFYNVTAGAFGRGFEKFRSLYTQLSDEAMARIVAVRPRLGAAPDGEALAALVRFQVRSPTGFADNAETTRFTDLPDSLRSTVRALTEAAALEEWNAELEFNKEIERIGLNRFSDLLNNQPQLHFGFDLVERDELVGPDEVAFRGTFEMGLTNLNSFRRQHRYCVTGLDTFDTSRCLDALTSFVEENSDRLDAGERLAFSLEFSRTEDYDFMLPGAAEPTMLPGKVKWAISGGFGRMIELGGDAGSTRLDVTVKYESPIDDENRNNRFVGSLIFTKRVGDVSIPFGVVYANRPEFLMDVDKRLSARVGLKFNVPGI